VPRFGPYKFYNDSITLWFNSDEHVYLREYGEELVPQLGVTSILRIIDKSEYLVPWAAKRTAEKLIAIMPVTTDGLDDYVESIRYEDFITLCNEAKKAPREILEDAGDVGTMAHNSLEDSIKYAIRNTNQVVEKLINVPPDARALSCCNAALDWMRRHNVKWVSTERKIYSLEYEYAGTMDGLAFVSSCDDPVCCPIQFVNVKSLIDWKSSNSLSVSYLYQISAYRQALLEETLDVVNMGFILRLGKEDGKFEPWHVTATEMDEDFQVFKSCMELTARHEEVKTRMSQAKKGRTQRKKAAKAAAKEKV
jgi:hypothetical protein